MKKALQWEYHRAKSNKEGELSIFKVPCTQSYGSRRNSSRRPCGLYDTLSTEERLHAGRED